MSVQIWIFLEWNFLIEFLSQMLQFKLTWMNLCCNWHRLSDTFFLIVCGNIQRFWKPSASLSRPLFTSLPLKRRQVVLEIQWSSNETFGLTPLPPIDATTHPPAGHQPSKDQIQTPPGISYLPLLMCHPPTDTSPPPHPLMCYPPHWHATRPSPHAQCLSMAAGMYLGLGGPSH